MVLRVTGCCTPSVWRSDIAGPSFLQLLDPTTSTAPSRPRTHTKIDFKLSNLIVLMGNFCISMYFWFILFILFLLFFFFFFTYIVYFFYLFITTVFSDALYFCYPIYCCNNAIFPPTGLIKKCYVMLSTQTVTQTWSDGGSEYILCARFKLGWQRHIRANPWPRSCTWSW